MFLKNAFLFWINTAVKSISSRTTTPVTAMMQQAKMVISMVFLAAVTANYWPSKKKSLLQLTPIQIKLIHKSAALLLFTFNQIVEEEFLKTNIISQRPNRR